MVNLLKSDLKRMFKDKLFLITCIIGAGFGILTSLLYYGLNFLVDSIEEGMAMFYAKDALAASFAPLNNFGFILPIFICIILNKDFSYGTIRNKIISGHSRTNIYLSLLISTSLLMLATILGYTIINFGVSSILLDYSITTTFSKDIGYILLTILFGLIGYILFSALIVFFCTSMKNAGLAIVLYFGISFFLTIAALAFSISIPMIDEKMSFLKDFLDVLCNLNIFYLFNNIIGYVDAYEVKEILYIVLDVVVFGGLVSMLGILLFNKKDLK